jgi:hypothetical protein
MLRKFYAMKKCKSNSNSCKNYRFKLKIKITEKIFAELNYCNLSEILLTCSSGSIFLA